MSKNSNTTLAKRDLLALRMRRDEDLFVTIRLLIRCIAVAFSVWAVAYYVSKAFGQTTSVQVNGVVKVLGDLRFAATVTLAGAASIWALVERAGRKRVVRKFAPYKREYEERSDPHRTTSKINSDGTTAKRDIKR
ncbi:hypothetical protein AA105894_0003 [Asaia spathodeae NBRC 105894]|nr:hypothetical protein AA105894_0003 [Asaia spathodeae NBRC 105894]